MNSFFLQVNPQSPQMFFAQFTKDKKNNLGL